MPITNQDVIDQIESDVFDNIQGLISPFRVRRVLNTIREYVNDSSYESEETLQSVTNRGLVTDKTIQVAGLKISELATIVGNFLSVDSTGSIIVNPDFNLEDFLDVNGSNEMLSNIKAGGFQIENTTGIKDTALLYALISIAGYRYLVAGDGNASNPIVDYSNVNDGSVPGGKTGFGLNTQGVSGRYGRLLFNLLSGSKNYQFPDASGILALILNTAYGIGWSGDTTHAPSADALYNEIEILKAIITSGTTVATVFDASTATTFPSGGSSTSKYRVVNSGANPSVVQGVSLETDDTFYPKSSTPGPVATDWYVIQANGDYATKTLNDGQIDVGSSANVRTPRTPSGAITMTNSGVFGLVASFVFGTIMTGVATVTATPILDGESMLVWFNKIQSQLTAMSALLLPTFPSSTGTTYNLKVLDGVASYEEDYNAYDTSIDIIDKLQANEATNWTTDNKYVGAVSGAITIGPGNDSQPGEEFPGVQVVVLTKYWYNCFSDGWYRIPR